VERFAYGKTTTQYTSQTDHSINSINSINFINSINSTNLILNFKIGFLEVTFWDILDILIVGFLIYQIYKLLRGSLAFNIVVGLAFLFIASNVVEYLQMGMLSSLLGGFVSLGLLALLIVFQPEVRRFLIVVGRGTMAGQENFIRRLLGKEWEVEDNDAIIQSILRAIQGFSKNKTGALIVFSRDANVESFANSGVILDANISSRLLESIFNKDSPLHDGAVIINANKIHSASCVLPVSDNSNLPDSLGLRHRAGVGVTETTDALALIVSEENGKFSVARNGKLSNDLSLKQVENRLKKIHTEFYEVSKTVNEE